MILNLGRFGRNVQTVHRITSCYKTDFSSRIISYVFHKALLENQLSNKLMEEGLLDILGKIRLYLLFRKNSIGHEWIETWQSTWSDVGFVI